MECPNCGATISDASTRCEYCQTPVVPQSPAEVSSAARRQAAVFEAIRRSPEFARAQSPERQAKLPTFSAAMKAIPLVFAGVFIAGSLVILVGFLTVGAGIGMQFGGWGGAPALCFAIVPLGFVAIGVLMLVHFWKKINRFNNSPTLARPAIVVGKRTHVSGGSGDSSASTHYYVTCEFEDGTRSEYEPLEQGLYSQISEQDAGVAFTRDAVLLDFDRVAV